MIGTNFSIDLGAAHWGNIFHSHYDVIKGSSWPAECPKNIDDLPKDVIAELVNNFDSVHIFSHLDRNFEYKDVVSYIEKHATITKDAHVNTATLTRIGKDMYFGHDESNTKILTKLKNTYSEYRWHAVKMDGHSDANFCPVVPGLIVSLCDVQEYEKTFPGWEVIYLPDQSWSKVNSFLQLKEKNKGKWWVPGGELNDEFTDFVEQWLGHWVGYVEETVFDVNMLVIDKHNVVCNNYNKEVFDAFARRGITPHVINFRHRYFWDGGLHCITSDVHREGSMEDYFTERK